MLSYVVPHHPEEYVIFLGYAWLNSGLVLLCPLGEHTGPLHLHSLAVRKDKPKRDAFPGREIHPGKYEAHRNAGHCP